MKLQPSQILTKGITTPHIPPKQKFIHRIIFEFEELAQKPFHRDHLSSSKSSGDNDPVKKPLTGFLNELNDFLDKGYSSNQKVKVFNSMEPKKLLPKEKINEGDCKEESTIACDKSEDLNHDSKAEASELAILRRKFKDALAELATEGRRSRHASPLSETELGELFDKIDKLSACYGQGLLASIVTRLKHLASQPKSEADMKMEKEEFELTIDILSLPNSLHHSLLIHIFNTIIYLHGLKGRKSVAFYLKDQLMERGIQTNGLTLASLMNSSLNLGDWRCALGLYDITKSKNLFEGRPVLRYLQEISVKTLCMAGRVSDALEIQRVSREKFPSSGHELLIQYCLPSKNTGDPKLIGQALDQFEICYKSKARVDSKLVRRLVLASFAAPEHISRAETVLDIAKVDMGFFADFGMLLSMLSIFQKSGDLKRARKYLLWAIDGRDGDEEALLAYGHLISTYLKCFACRTQPTMIYPPPEIIDIRTILNRATPFQPKDVALELEQVMRHIKSIYQPHLLQGKIYEVYLLTLLRLGCVHVAFPFIKSNYLDRGELPPLGVLVHLFHRCFDFNLHSEAMQLWAATELHMSALWAEASDAEKCHIRSKYFFPTATLASLYLALINGMARINQLPISLTLLTHMSQDPTLKSYMSISNFHSLQTYLSYLQNRPYLDTFNHILLPKSNVKIRSDTMAMGLARF